MTNDNYIKICDLHATDNILTAGFEFSENLKVFFSTKKYFAHYDVDISNLDYSILAIPVVSTLVHLAWATGAVIHLDSIDKTYYESIKRLSYVYKNKYKNFSTTNISCANGLVDNRESGDMQALLFSGGVDSLYSYACNYKAGKLALISVWGLDVPLNRPTFWENVRRKLSDFAERNRNDIHFIKTNVQEIFQSDILNKKFAIHGWWQDISHGLITSSLCAPLSITEFNKILLSSSGKGFVGATSLLRDAGGISWSGVSVSVCGDTLTRHEKLKSLKLNPTYLSYLRVCWSQHTYYNCGKCEKCLRTIIGLLLEGIDPNMCNFQINDRTLDLVKSYFINGLISDSAIFSWKDIQANIPGFVMDRNINSKYKTEDFFDWFENFSLENYHYNPSYSPLIKIYLNLANKNTEFFYKNINDLCIRLIEKV